MTTMMMKILFGCLVVVSTAVDCTSADTHISFSYRNTRLKKSSDMRSRDNNVKSNDISTIPIHSLIRYTPFVVSFSFTFRFLLSLVGMIDLSFLLLFH